MSDVSVRSVSLGKVYTIGSARETTRTLRDALTHAVKRPLERVRHPGAATHVSEEFWALRGVNLEVKRGEMLGVIGRNGAGKSTFLKVLSHITQPSEGRVEIRGRVGSLLEVGTGFHQELTGRENIYMNGAILGMRRAETKARFDDIVDFAEIGQFLDTPVKRYSSGMYVRLAFAVAAHLDPEILIVDEVLAVGDAAFQEKCLTRMGTVGAGGRTVIFVSHNMQAIQRLCNTAVEIEGGRVVNAGEARSVVATYLSQQAEAGASATWEPGQGPGDEEARLVSVEVLDADGEPANLVTTVRPFSVRLEVDLTRLDRALCIGFDMTTSDGAVVMRSYQTDVDEADWPALRIGRNSIECTIPPGLLNDGRYFVMPRIGLHWVRWIVNGGSVVSFQVHRDTGTSPLMGERPGAIAPVLSWKLV